MEEELTVVRMTSSGRPETGRGGGGDGEMRWSEEGNEDHVSYASPRTDEASSTEAVEGGGPFGRAPTRRRGQWTRQQWRGSSLHESSKLKF